MRTRSTLAFVVPEHTVATDAASPAPDLAAADHAARHWAWPEPGALPIGGDAHREALLVACFATPSTHIGRRSSNGHR